MTRPLPSLPPAPAVAPDPVLAAVAALPLPAGEPGARWTPTTATAAWLRARRSPHTRRAYFRDLAGYLTWLAAAGLDPRDARRGDVDTYLTTLRARPRPPAAATVARTLSALSSWYRYLHDHDLAARNPITTVDRPTVDRDHSPTIGLTVTEVRALLRAADTDTSHQRLRNRALLGVLTDLGLRVSEATGLDVDDLRHHAGHRTLLIRGKGGRHRQLPVPTPLGRHLDAYLTHRQGHTDGAVEGSALAASGPRGDQLRHASQMPPPALDATAGPLFATSHGNPLTQAAVFALVRRLAHAAGLPAADHISPHSLRHTAATAALDDGAPLRDVQDFLGHADPRTTRRYDRNRGNLDRSPAHRLAVLYAE